MRPLSDPGPLGRVKPLGFLDLWATANHFAPHRLLRVEAEVDAELLNHLRRAQEGDLDAFCYVATAHRAQASSTARSILRDTHQAEDAVQEALLIALTKLPTLNDPLAFSGWLRALVRTACFRSRRRRRPDLAEDLDRPGADLTHDAVHEGEQRALVRAAVRELPSKAQAVIERFYLRGLSVKETAAELGLPAGTVKRRLHEGRERLRPQLLGFAPTPTNRPPRPRSLRLPL
jgi:RNA polymerase sigma factor (sigma-70 family)